MEESLRSYKFFVVSKGRDTGIFTSFDEASAQVVDYPYAEYQAFNCQATAVGAYTARLHAIQIEKAALEEMTTEFGVRDSPPAPTTETVPTSDGRCAALYWTINPLPPTEAASCNFANFAINISMEEWLLKVCYVASLPTPAFFRHEIFTRDAGIHYAFNVVLPGNLLGQDVCAKGRYSPIESDAREDAAFNMLDKVLAATRQQIRDYNYYKWISLQRKVERLEFKCSTHGYDSSPDMVSL